MYNQLIQENLYGKCMFNYIRSFPNVFRSDCTTLYFKQQCMRDEVVDILIII